MVNQIRKIDYINKPGELSALLYESDMVKKHLPIYNKRLRKNKILYLVDLTQKDLVSGLLTINTRKVINPTYGDLENSYGPFRSKAEISGFLESIVKEFKLCRKALGIENVYREDQPCFNYELGKCIGVCDIELEDKARDLTIDKHNTLLKTSLEREQYEKWPFSSPIVLKEADKESGLQEYHLVNNWCLVGTYSSMDELESNLESSEAERFDIDKYKLLKSFIKRNDVEIIKI